MAAGRIVGRIDEQRGIVEGRKIVGGETQLAAGDRNRAFDVDIGRRQSERSAQRPLQLDVGRDQDFAIAIDKSERAEPIDADEIGGKIDLGQAGR